MDIAGVRKKKNPNLPAPDNTARNALISQNVDETFFKKSEPEKPVSGGGSYSENTEKIREKTAPKVEAEMELRKLMGIPEGNTAMLDKKTVKNFLKKAGVDTGGVNLDNPAEVLSAYQRTKGNSPKDPREAPKVTKEV